MVDVDSVDDASLATAITKIVDMEKAIHLDDVHFLSATVSIVRAPGTTRLPTDFKSIALTGNGLVHPDDTDKDNLPKELVVKVAHNASSGRAGSCLYRRALTATGWTDNSGEAVFSGTTQADIQDSLHTKYVATGFPPFVLLPKDADADTEGRLVTEVSVLGIFGRQENRRGKKSVPNTSPGIIENIKNHLEGLAAAFGAAQGLKMAGKWVLSGGPDAVLTTLEELAAAGVALFTV